MKTLMDFGIDVGAKSGTVEIALTKGLTATVDAEDFDRVSQHSWRATVRNTVVYAGRGWREGGKQRHEYLHRFILNAAPGVEVDHIDGNGLNCSKANLRPATHSQNAMNRGRFAKGVSFHKRSGKFRAYIKVAGKQIHLGEFDSEDLAIAARETAVIKFFGEFDSRKAERTV